MKTEYEIRIIGINPAEVKKKLESIDAIHRGIFIMRRCVYDVPGKKEHAWVRLRDDGERVTLAYKIRERGGIKGIKETETRVQSFEKTKQILDSINLKFVAYQENRRDQYQLGDIEFSIDEWPLLPPHVEIEGRDEKDVKRGVELLGYKMEQTTTKTMLGLYKDKGIDQHKFKKLTFAVQE